MITFILMLKEYFTEYFKEIQFEAITFRQIMILSVGVVVGGGILLFLGKHILYFLYFTGYGVFTIPPTFIFVSYILYRWSKATNDEFDKLFSEVFSFAFMIFAILIFLMGVFG